MAGGDVIAAMLAPLGRSASPRTAGDLGLDPPNEIAFYDAIRAVGLAARRSASDAAVELAGALHRVDGATDLFLVFEVRGEDLVCVHASGERGKAAYGLRLRRNDLLRPGGACATLLPGDRDAVTVPILDGDGAVACVLYAAAARPSRLQSRPVRRLLELGGWCYVQSCEREANRRAASYDGLTGLLGPRAFRSLLRKELDSGPVVSSAALWFIDTDDFKQVNDSLGHAAGDAVLQRIAETLRAHARVDLDVPARNGGDEFCLYQRSIGKAHAVASALRLCASVRSTAAAFGRPTTVSIGVAAFPADADSAAELLEAADAAMYASKRAGRDRVSFLDAGGLLVTSGG